METASDKLEEGGDDVKSSWPLRPGLHVLQWRIQREATSREQADLIKCVVVRIESATRLMKSESLVIVDQNATVNTFPGLVHTARHTMGVGCKKK